LLLLVSVFIFSSCSHTVTSQGHARGKSTMGQHISSAPCIIYKTKADYSHRIPVVMNEKKSAITSYPDKKDIYYQGRLAYPAELADGFLLDNRGIGANVAFLDYTYEEYQKLEQTPTADQLMKRILDKDPVTEMYRCGNRSQYEDIVNDLKKLITSGNLSSCKKIK